jgi:hypothetical protein
MASLTLTEFTAEVVLACRNLSTADPYYPLITKYLTRARNKIIRQAIGPRLNVDLFPELHNSWTIGPTYPNSTGIVGNVISKPADCIAVTEVQSAQSATLPDWSVTREIKLTYQEPAMFGILTKGSVVTPNYANIYTRKGKSIVIFPTPSASYVDYLRVYGIKSESPLVNPGDTFFADEQWDDATVLKCAAMIQKRRGWDAAAASLLEDVEAELAQTANVSGLEEIAHESTLHASGGATRYGAYHRP